jgi:hypothetical protein
MRIGTEAHPRCTEQRDAAHHVEIRHVAMPAERAPRPVLGDQGVEEVVRIDARPAGHLGAQRQEELRNGRPGQQRVVVEVVARAEARDAPLGGIALVLRLGERNPADLGDEPGFLVDADELGLVGEPVGRCLQ